MKKLFFLLALILAVGPVLADDLHPVAQDQAIQQYQDFWKTETPDPMNHIVWKLYVYRAIPPAANPKSALEFLVGGLSPYHNYYVRLNINQLYNFLHPLPQRGDVIVVSGRVRDHRDYHATLPKKEVILKSLTLDLDDANAVPNEHFDPSVWPSPTPGAAPAVSPAVGNPTSR